MPVCGSFVTVRRLAQDEVSWTREVITEAMDRIGVGEVFFMLSGSEDNGQLGFEPCTIIKIEQF